TKDAVYRGRGSGTSLLRQWRRGGAAALLAAPFGLLPGRARSFDPHSLTWANSRSSAWFAQRFQRRGAPLADPLEPLTRSPAGPGTGRRRGERSDARLPLPQPRSRVHLGHDPDRADQPAQLAESAGKRAQLRRRPLRALRALQALPAATGDR